MPFEFSEEQKIFRHSIREFVAKEILPRSKQIGKGKRIPSDLWRKICGLGIMGIQMPEQYGGHPGDLSMMGIAAEEIGKADFSLASTLAPNRAFCVLLQQALPQVQQEWLPPIIGGEKLGAIAVTELDSGTDAAAMKTTATKEGDHYILNGEKASVAWGMYADAAAVFVKTNPNSEAEGVSCFLVPLELPGISKSNSPDMGLTPITRPSITLDNVRLHKDYLIGQEGKGFAMLMEELDFTRILIALAAIGAAEVSLDEAIAYARQRVAFGKHIGKFEGVSFKIAEDATLLEAARLLCYRALGLRDRGVKHTKESAMCKWWSPKIAVEVIHHALLIHGNIGYSSEHLIEQRMRDVIGSELAGGTPEAMKLILVRELLGKEFLPY